MKQSDFEKKYQAFWTELESKLQLDAGQVNKLGNKQDKKNKRDQSAGRFQKNIDLGSDFPENYRLLCHHLSLARSRHYSPLLVNRLEKLVINAHQLYYQRKTHLLSSVLVYFTSGFARAIRREWRLVALSSVLFFGTFFGMIFTLQFYPDMVYTVISGEELAQMEMMYRPNEGKLDEVMSKVLLGRSSGTDFQMFGYYIFNNAGIGLKTFASGLLFGIGSVLTLLFNGLVIGAVAGHLHFIGYGETFWPFVSGHSAMELTAIVLSGAAGLKLGFAIISPGRKSRLRSLRDSALEAVYIMYGVSVMFFIAAFIEAYWSSMTDIPAMVKYVVGIVFWLVVIGYFVFVGRSRATR